MIAGMGNLFGIEDISNDRKVTTTVRCISNSGTLITIKAQDFLNFLQRDEQIWDGFRNLAEQRDNTTIGMIRNNRMIVKKFTAPLVAPPTG